MRFSRRIGQVLLAGILGTGLLFGLAGPAAAADGWQRARNVDDGDFYNGYEKSCIPEYKVTVCFQRHGEHFWIRDEVTDGIAVAVSWEFFNRSTWREGVIYNNHGKDAGWTHKNKSFPEGGTVSFRACTVRSIANKRLGACSPPEYSRS